MITKSHWRWHVSLLSTPSADKVWGQKQWELWHTQRGWWRTTCCGCELELDLLVVVRTSVTRWSQGTCTDLILLMHDACAVKAGNQSKPRERLSVLGVNLIRVVILIHPQYGSLLAVMTPRECFCLATHISDRSRSQWSVGLRYFFMTLNYHSYGTECYRCELCTQPELNPVCCGLQSTADRPGIYPACCSAYGVLSCPHCHQQPVTAWSRHHVSDRLMSMSGSIPTCAQCVQTTTWSQASHPPFNCLMLLICNGVCRYWFIATHCSMRLHMAEQYQSSLRLTAKSGGADTLFWRTQSCLTSVAFLWLQGQPLHCVLQSTV